MNKKEIQEELNQIAQSSFAKKTDKQLLAYELLHQIYKGRNAGFQAKELIKFNNPVNRKCKLTPEQVDQIRTKYVPHIYGKKRLADEFGVSASVIFRIVNYKSWKEYQEDG
jgi:hypothetical protein